LIDESPHPEYTTGPPSREITDEHLIPNNTERKYIVARIGRRTLDLLRRCIKGRVRPLQGSGQAQA
jgi:hypothetical protein